MKFNMGKNNSNNYISMKESFHNLKKSGGSATELLGKNYIKKQKTRTCSDLNNINQIGYILINATTSNNNSNNNKLYLSPRTPAQQKIIFLKMTKIKKKNILTNILIKILLKLYKHKHKQMNQ
jgi:hypothetical protein